MPSRPPLTTTSFAVLAQLAMRPWSAYELAAQQQRYFQFFWPRARSGLFRELKHLAALGVATSSTVTIGRRGHRTMYDITPAGRDELRRWLDSPLSPITIEFEGLVRVFAATQGTREQLLANLERIRAEASELVEFNDQIRAEYLDGRAPFNHDAHVRTLVVDFMADYFDLIQAWATRSADEVQRWPDLTPDAPRLARARERVERPRDVQRPRGNAP